MGHSSACNYNFYTVTVLKTFCLSALLTSIPSLSSSLESHQPKIPKREPMLWLDCSLSGTQGIRIRFSSLNKFRSFSKVRLRERRALITLLDFIWLKQFVPVPAGLFRSRPGLWLWRGCSHLSSSPHFACFSLGCCSAVHRHPCGSQCWVAEGNPSSPWHGEPGSLWEWIVL